MRLLLALLVATPFLYSCGQSAALSPCAGDHVGTWSASNGDQLTLSSACAYSYVRPGSGACQSAGTYAAPLGTSGSVAVEITSTSGACVPVGTYTCAYTRSSSSLQIDCGNGASTYTK